MFSTRDPCALVVFLDIVGSEGTEGTWSSYKLHSVGNCHRAEVIKRLQRIRVLSHKLKLNAEEV